MRLAKSSTALSVVAWIASLLALTTAVLILCIWLLVPNDPSQSSSQNIVLKLRPMGGFTVGFLALLALVRWCFARRRLIEQSIRKTQ